MFLLSSRRLLPSIIAVFTLALALSACASAIRSYIYYPEIVDKGSVQLSEGARWISVRTKDNRTLEGVFLAARRASEDSQGLVVYAHGNGGNAVLSSTLATGLVNQGYDVLVADYRGYGVNRGEPSEKGLRRDLAAFVAKAHNMTEKPVILVGHSLGGSLAIVSANSLKIDGLVTIGALTDLREMAPSYARSAMDDRFHAFAAASKVSVPWVIAHARDDDIIPFAMGQRLSEQNPKARFVEQAGGHQVTSDMLVKLVARLRDVGAF